MVGLMGKTVADSSPGQDEIRRLLDLLRDAPLRIASATQGVDPARLRQRTTDEPWSINDVLAHIRAAADNRERYIDAMAAGRHATLSYRSARSELARTDYLDLSFLDNLGAFASKRAGLVKRLEALRMEDWSRGSTIRD